MKRTIQILFMLFLAAQLPAQDIGLAPRPYKPEELKRWTMICEALSSAVPASFKEYTVKKDNCGGFEWSERDTKNRPLTVINKKGEPIGNNPNFSTWYSKNEDSANADYIRMTGELKESQNTDGSFPPEALKRFSAMTMKMDECKTLRVYMSTNVQVSVDKQYFAGAKPEKIMLPVPGFAYLYTFPMGKVALDEDGSELPGTDAQAYLKDKALIIFSTVAPKITTEFIGGKSNYKTEKITPQDKAPENIMAPVKNIFIDITGSEEDVRSIIQQIDWKALKALIGK